jgi:hypothetical protein
LGSSFGLVVKVVMALSPGLREGSKLMILIFGRRPSIPESTPLALADRFLLRDALDDDDSGDDDITITPAISISQ